MPRFRTEVSIRDHDTGRDGGQKSGHDGKQFGTGHPLQVAAQGGCGFNTGKYQQRRAKRFRARRFQGAAHDPGHGADHGLNNTQVLKNARQPGHKNNNRQYIKREDGIDDKRFLGRQLTVRSRHQDPLKHK